MATAKIRCVPPPSFSFSRSLSVSVSVSVPVPVSVSVSVLCVSLALSALAMQWFDVHIQAAAAHTVKDSERDRERDRASQISDQVAAIMRSGSGVGAYRDKDREGETERYSEVDGEIIEEVKSRAQEAREAKQRETEREGGREDFFNLLMRALRADCAALKQQVAELHAIKAGTPDARDALRCQVAISCCEDIFARKRAVAQADEALRAAGSCVWQVLEARNTVHELRLIKQKGSNLLRVKGKCEAVEHACEILRRLPQEPAGPWNLRDELRHRPCPVEQADGVSVQGPSLGGLLAIAAGDVGCVAAVELLASFGAASSLSEADAGNSGFTAALRAAKNGEVEFLRALYKHGAGQSLSAANHSGCTPARLACQEGHAAVLNTLVECGALASLSAVKTNGTAPAHVAAQQGHVECIRTIAQHAGIEVISATNNRGLTLAHFAANMGRLGCLEAIEQLGCAATSFGAKSSKKSTPLHLAAAKGHASCVRFLLRQCTTPSAQFPGGRYCGSLEALGPIVPPRRSDRLRQATAMQMAACMGHLDATMELLLAGASLGRLGPGPSLLPRRMPSGMQAGMQAGLAGLVQQAAAVFGAGVGGAGPAGANAGGAPGVNAGGAGAAGVGGAAGAVAGVAQQLAQGLAAALQNGGPAGPQQLPGAPGIVFHQFAIPLGNAVAGGGAGVAGAAAAAGLGAAAHVGSSDSAAPTLPPGAVEVLEIPPESEMASYLRVVRGNAPLRAAQLRLCWAMALSFDKALGGRPVLPGDLYGQVAEHVQPARVALMLHRRARDITDGIWDRY